MARYRVNTDELYPTYTLELATREDRPGQQVAQELTDEMVARINAAWDEWDACQGLLAEIDGRATRVPYPPRSGPVQPGQHASAAVQRWLDSAEAARAAGVL